MYGAEDGIGGRGEEQGVDGGGGEVFGRHLCG